MKKLLIDKKIRLIKLLDLKDINLNNKKINLIDVPFKQKKRLIKFQIDLMII